MEKLALNGMFHIAVDGLFDWSVLKIARGAVEVGDTETVYHLRRRHHDERGTAAHSLSATGETRR